MLNVLTAESDQIWVVLALFLIGVFFAIYAAVFWSCTPLIVSEHKQGIAFGIVYSSLNIVLVIASLFIGTIHDMTKDYKGGYEWCVNFMIFSLCFAVISVFVLMYFDRLKGGPLNSKNTNSEIRDKLNRKNNKTEEFLLEGVN